MDHRVLFVGRPKRAHIAPALAAGLHVVALVKPRGKRSGNDDRDEDGVASESIAVDLDNVDTVLAMVAAYHTQSPFGACFTRFESLVPLAARIAAELGLRGPGVVASALTRDKLRMREAFAAAGVPQPRFAGISTAAELARAADSLGLPLIVKPLTGAHSRHVHAYRTHAELAEFAAHERAFLGDRAKILRRRNEGPLWIAEQMMTGRQLTTTTIVVDGEPRHLDLVDVRSARDLGRPSFQLLTRTSPARLTREETIAVENAATAAVQALGLRDTCAHPELLLTPEGPIVIEVAARIGGFRSQLTRHALGLDLDAAAIALALGQPMDLTPRCARAATAVEVWPPTGGRIVRHPHAEAVRQTPGIHELHVALAPDATYEPPPAGGRPLATFLAVADDAEASLQLAFRAMAQLEAVEFA